MSNQLKTVRRELRNKGWFKASKKKIRDSLMALGEECLGFLEDLERRPDVIGGVKVLRLAELLIPKARPIYGIFVVFQVQRTDNKKVKYHYQYFSWKGGPYQSAKGIGIVKEGGKVTHIAVQKGERFAPGHEVFDAIGGFTGPHGRKGFGREIEEELGISVRGLRIVDLGRLLVDLGLTNNHPAVFAIEINANRAKEIARGKRVNPDVLELDSGLVVIPVEKIKKHIFENDDSFLHIVLLRYLCKYGTFSFERTKPARNMKK